MIITNSDGVKIDLKKRSRERNESNMASYLLWKRPRMDEKRIVGVNAITRYGKRILLQICVPVSKDSFRMTTNYYYHVVKCDNFADAIATFNLIYFIDLSK